MTGAGVSKDSEWMREREEKRERERESRACKRNRHERKDRKGC